MRYIKTYEELNLDVMKVGYYVIAEITVDISDRFDKNYVDFISTHIGTISTINREFQYVGIDYDEDVPGNDESTNYTFIDTRFVKYFSENREELEVILNSKKYNI